MNRMFLSLICLAISGCYHWDCNKYFEKKIAPLSINAKVIGLYKDSLYSNLPRIVLQQMDSTFELTLTYHEASGLGDSVQVGDFLYKEANSLEFIRQHDGGRQSFLVSCKP